MTLAQAVAVARALSDEALDATFFDDQADKLLSLVCLSEIGRRAPPRQDVGISPRGDTRLV